MSQRADRPLPRVPGGRCLAAAAALAVGHAAPGWIDQAPIRCALVGAVLLEQHDEWAVSERRYLSEESMALIDQHLKEVNTTDNPELPAA